MNVSALDQIVLHSLSIWNIIQLYANKKIIRVCHALRITEELYR